MPKSTRKKRKFSSKDYEQVQTLIDLDIKASDVRKITGWSDAVVYQVKSTSNYDEYVAANEKRMQNHLAKKNGKSNGETEKTIAQKIDEANTAVSVLKAIEHNQLQMIALLEKVVNKKRFL